MCTEDELKSFFSYFGDISSLRVDLKKRVKIGSVHFQRPETAAQVLKQLDLAFKGYIVRVATADCWHQPGWLRTVSSPFSFENDVDPNPQLNDDCLRRIFDYLNMWDLVSVADVCPRFEQIAQERFAREHKKFNFDDFVFEKKTRGQLLTGRKIRNFLKHFGSSIVELDVSSFQLSDSQCTTNDFLRMVILSHCSETLKVLKIRNTLLDSRIPTSDTNSFMHALSNCKQLTKMKIDGKWKSFISNSNFTSPALTTISLENMGKLNHMGVSRILQRHPQLKQITIANCAIDPQIICAFVHYVPHLEKLSLVNNSVPASSRLLLKFIAQLTSLKRLSIDNITQAWTTALLLAKMGTANVPLEHLNLNGCSASDELVRTIGTIKSICSLRFTNVYGLEKSHLVELVKLLPKLTKLDARCSPCRNLGATDLAELILRAPRLEEIDLECTKIVINDKTYRRLAQTARKQNPPFALKVTLFNPLKLFHPPRHPPTHTAVLTVVDKNLKFGRCRKWLLVN